jgi:endonuclease/exonuclease/phosphatase family metal-dependent hydrolase
MLSVASYNIHRCIGTDSLYRPGRIVEVLRRLDADVVGLQEIDAHVMHPEGHQLDLIAKNTGYSFVIGGTLFHDEAEYGNAILSRFPILASEKYDLTVDRREPRGAISIDLEAHGHRFRVINTHLGLKYYERRRQVRALFGILDRDPEIPKILMGDFNEWVPFFGSTLRLFRQFHHARGIRTFPATKPLLCLDQVFIDRKGILAGAKVMHSKLASRASDHLPIKAQLRL